MCQAAASDLLSFDSSQHTVGKETKPPFTDAERRLGEGKFLPMVTREQVMFFLISSSALSTAPKHLQARPVVKGRDFIPRG